MNKLIHFLQLAHGHRRTGSYGTTPIVTSASDMPLPREPSLHHAITAPGNLTDTGIPPSNEHNEAAITYRSASWSPGEQISPDTSACKSTCVERGDH